jgi:hypothetical protein
MALTQVDQGMLGTNAQYTGFKNRIINGAMVIDQRNAGASVTPANNDFSVDRWRCLLTQSSKFTIQQNAGSVTPPTGFGNYVGVTSSSAYSVTSSDSFTLLQNIEGFNTSDLAFGTASASSVALSFWVRSSLTGTFGGSLSNSAVSRSYPFSYTISTANTWEYKTITIAGDTSGTWIGATNGIGLRVFFNLGSGSTYSGTAGAWASADYRAPTGATSVVGTNGATFYITGVQLEKGSTATSFDYVDYGRLLIQCQRYFQLVFPTAGNATTSTVADMIVSCFTPMRANATLNQNGVLAVYDDQVGPFTQSSTSIVNLGNPNNVVNTIRLGNFSGMTANRFLIGSPGNPSNYVTLSAEL